MVSLEDNMTRINVDNLYLVLWIIIRVPYCLHLHVYFTIAGKEVTMYFHFNHSDKHLLYVMKRCVRSKRTMSTNT